MTPSPWSALKRISQTHGLTPTEIGSKDFLGDVVALTNGKRGWEAREEALKLIQEWGLAFQGQRNMLFYETYTSLKVKGKEPGRAPRTLHGFLTGGSGARSDISRAGDECARVHTRQL